MSRGTLSLFALVGAAIAAQPAIAQANEQNVKCLMAANVFATSEKDPAKKQLAQNAAFFYLGRLGGQVSPPQLKAQIVAQAKALNAQTAGPTMNACVQEIGVKQRIMQDVGKELQASQAKK